MNSARYVTLLLGLALAALLAAACGASGPEPKIVEHPRPTLTVDAGAFAGDTLATELGCNWIEGPSSLYGGLEPRYPVAVCAREWQQPEDECLYTSGGIFQTCYQAIVEMNGEFRLVGDREELGAMFAPIDSADEALGLALLATKLSAKYEPEDYRLDLPGDCDPGPEHYVYYTDTLEDTHVVEVADGYEVYLFRSQQFGCGPHPVSSVTVQVSRDGLVTQVADEKLFEEDMDDPKIATCCVD